MGLIIRNTFALLYIELDTPFFLNYYVLLVILYCFIDVLADICFWPVILSARHCLGGHVAIVV